MNTIKIPTSQNIELEYDLASLGERILGSLIDILVIIAYLIVLVFLAWSLSSGYMNGFSWTGLILYVPVYFYNLACEVFMNGQSIGKKVMNIKVISIDGARPGFGQYLIRWVFRLIDISLSGSLCGIICIAASEKKQRVGDMVAGTAVIKTEPRTHFQQTLYVPPPQPGYVVTYPQIATLGDEDIQLLKEVIMVSRNSGNISIAEKAAAKICDILHVSNNLEPLRFLNLLVSDYNYLTSQGEAW